MSIDDAFDGVSLVVYALRQSRATVADVPAELKRPCKCWECETPRRGGVAGPSPSAEADERVVRALAVLSGRGSR